MPRLLSVVVVGLCAGILLGATAPWPHVAEFNPRAGRPELQFRRVIVDSGGASLRVTLVNETHRDYVYSAYRPGRIPCVASIWESGSAWKTITNSGDGYARLLRLAQGDSIVFDVEHERLPPERGKLHLALVMYALPDSTAGAVRSPILEVDAR